MYTYKIDVLEEMKKKGYTTYRLKKEKIFGEAVIQKFREKNTSISLDTVFKIIQILDCKFEDIFKPESQIV